MKLLVASINFAPDHAGIGVYSTDFAVYMAERGHSVTVVTGFSYYPRWEKRDADRKRIFAQELYRGVRVLRGYLYVPKRVSTLRRLLHEASFCFFAALNFIRADRPDAMVIFKPPFLLGAVAWLAAKCWRCPLVVNIQDLPVDAAMALGMLKPGLAMRCLLGVEAWLYRHADQVVSISDSMLEKVWSKGVSKARTRLVPNWVNVDEYAAPAKSGEFRGNHTQANGKFIAAYAGNLGIKQGVDVLILLAKAVERDPRFHFFVIGDGADRPRLIKLVQYLKLTNLTFLPFMDPERYRKMLADVDVVFVAQRKGAGNNFFPSKLLGLMAAQKALLVAADRDSELARTIVKGGFGLVSEYEDIEGLENNLRRYANGEVSVINTGHQGLAAVKNFDRAFVLSAWENSISQLVNGDQI